jgi:hypothetical protein
MPKKGNTAPILNTSANEAANIKTSNIPVCQRRRRLRWDQRHLKRLSVEAVEVAEAVDAVKEGLVIESGL